MRLGIPHISDVQRLEQSDQYNEHRSFCRAFITRHKSALSRYSFQWGADPFQHWSRRWEYPFAADRVETFAAQSPDGELHLLDAGSGVTYLPFYLSSRLPRLRITCCDSHSAYGRIFDRVQRRENNRNVTFRTAALQQMPFAEASFDAACCISVLEHTDDYFAIINELTRVLRPGGLLVLTFDLSLDDCSALSKSDAARLMEHIDREFQPSQPLNYRTELDRIDHSGDILNTDFIRRTAPQLLPWPYPRIKAMLDLFRGHGFTGGFRSKSILCLDLRKKGP